MVDERITDGRRIAQLLASEVDGRDDGALARLAVTDADPEIEPTDDGALAYRIERDDESFATVFVQPTRAYVELREGVEVAAETADDGGLRVRPKAVEPPRTIVFVEDGAEVKRATDAIEAAAESSGVS